MLGRLGPDQLGPEVARGMRAAVKDENPDAYLIGEHFFDATDAARRRPVGRRHELRGLHQAGPRLAERHRVPRATASARSSPADPDAPTADWSRSLDAFRAAVPWAVARCQYNLLDSHDTAAGPDASVGDPGRRPGGVRDAARLRRRARRFLYGDEVGLEGVGRAQHAARRCRGTRRPGTSTSSRSPRTLVRFRVRSRALQAGGFQVLEAGDDSLAFLRDTDDEQVIAIVVRGPGSRPGDLPVAIGAIADGTVFTSLLTGERATVAGGRLPLPPTPPGAAFWRTGG